MDFGDEKLLRSGLQSFLPCCSRSFYFLKIIRVFSSFFIISFFFFGSLNSMNDTLALDFLGRKKQTQFGPLRLFASLGFFVAVIFTGFLYQLFGLKFLFLVFSASMFCTAMVIRQINLSHTPLTKPSHGTKKVLVFLRKKICVFFF